MKKLWIALLLTCFGLATATAQQTTPPTSPGTIVCAYQTVLPTITANNFGFVQCDTNGRLLTTASGGTFTGNITQFGSSNIVTGTGISGAGIPRVTVSSDSAISLSGTIAANITQFGGSAVVTGIGVSGAGIPRVTVSSDSSTSTTIGPTVNGADAISNTSVAVRFIDNTATARPAIQVLPLIFNGTSWDRAFTCPSTAVVNVTAAATTQLVANVAATFVRVCSMALTISLTGSAKFVEGTGTNCGTGTTDVTAAMALSTATPLTMSIGENSIFRTAVANHELCLAAVTGNVTGFITYAQF